ncbi:hypothetical protein K456DRAFT_1722462 [Colletotrichum gloeosporioides 23]|nr:hypothetical protein K456DRAFT_1722462 [Colletotrichum gloeosporioides 23]
MRPPKPTGSSPLDKIPPEIVLAITEDLPQFSVNSLCQASKRLHQIINPSLYKAAIKTPQFVSVAALDGKLDTLKVAALFGAHLNRVYWVPAPSWSLLCWGDDDSDCSESGDSDCSESDDPEFSDSDSPGSRIGDDHIFDLFGFKPIHDDGEGSALPHDLDIGYCWATPFHLAAAEGHYDMVEWLLAQGVDLNVPGKLFCPCSSFSEVLVEGPCRSILSSGTWAPLHYAICRSHPKIALLLIDSGASMEVRYSRSKDIPRTHGIDELFGLAPCLSASEIRQSLGHLLIYHLGIHPDSDGEEDDHEEDGPLSEQYLRRCLQYNMSAIHCAALSNEPEILRHLVDLGISVDTADGCRANILYHAVERRNLEMVRCTLSLHASPSASACIVDKMHIKYRVEGICQWVARFCHDSNPDYLDAVIVMLAEHGGDSVFWQQPDPWYEAVVDLDGEDNHAEGEDVEHESIRPKSMTINIIARHMINPFKDCAKRSWVSLLLRGAIATYQPTEDFNDLKKELVAFFWRIIDDCGCAAAALEMILQSYDSFDLTELMDGELPLKRVKTNYEGQLGTAALHMLLTDYKVRSHEQAEFEVTVRDKAAWLLKHGADPVDKFHHPAKFAALPCFLARLNVCEPRDFLHRSSRQRVADMMRILGEHGAWEIGDSETQHAVRTWDEIVRKVEHLNRNSAKAMRKVVLPSRVSAIWEAMIDCATGDTSRDVEIKVME